MDTSRSKQEPLLVFKLLKWVSVELSLLLFSTRLKVDGNENEGGGEEHSNSGSVWHCGDRGLFAIWTCCFSVKLIIFVSGCYSFINRHSLGE